MRPRTHFEAVQAGVFDAINGAIRNETTAPTFEFFASVQEGIREAVADCVSGDLLCHAITEGVRLALLEMRGES